MSNSPRNNSLGFERVEENLFQANLPLLAEDCSSQEVFKTVREIQAHLSLMMFQALVSTLKEQWPEAILGVRLSYLRPSDSTSSGLNLKVDYDHEQASFSAWSAAEEALHQAAEPFFKDSDTYFQHLVSMAFSNKTVRREDLDGLLDAALVGDPRLNQVKAVRLSLQLEPAAHGPKPPRL